MACRQSALRLLRRLLAAQLLLLVVVLLLKRRPALGAAPKLAGHEGLKAAAANVGAAHAGGHVQGHACARV